MWRVGEAGAFLIEKAVTLFGNSKLFNDNEKQKADSHESIDEGSSTTQLQTDQNQPRNS
jgi:hypothetical protein